MILVLLFTLLYVIVDAQDNCQELIQDSIQLYNDKGIVAMMESLPSVSVLYSGRELNDLGFYDSCLEVGFNYFTVQFIVPAPNQLNIGICVPNYCQSHDFDQYSHLITNHFNAILFNNLEVIKNVVFIDPIKTYPKFDILTGFVLAFVTLLILLSIIGSIISFYHQGKLSWSYLNSEQQDDQFKNPKNKQLSPLMQILLCFSFYDNLLKLFEIKSNGKDENNFKIFNGIRVLSISWVIYAHTYIILALGMKNIQSFVFVAKQVGWITLNPGGYMAVDVFFFIGGFLTGVLLVEKLLKIKKLSPIIIPGIYLHRLLRLWPTYMTCLFFFWKITPYLGNGPMWNHYISFTDYCNTQWWHNFLLIDNLFDHVLDYCYGWGWYLANDFQIFLTAPPLLYLYIKNKKLGMIMTWLLLFITLLISFIICQIKGYHVNFPDPTAPPQPDYLSFYYFKPWVRASPYYYGILYGFLYLEWMAQNGGIVQRLGEKIKASGWIRLFMYIVGNILVQWTVWIIIPIQKDMNNWSQLEQSLYQTFGRIIFLTGLGILILPAILKVQNDPISIFLSMNFFVPLARVSFCVYLVHFAIIMGGYLSSREMIFYQSASPVYQVASYTIMSFILGALVSLLAEVPIMNLEKVSFKNKNKSLKSEKNDQQEQKNELQLLNNVNSNK